MPRGHHAAYLALRWRGSGPGRSGDGDPVATHGDGLLGQGLGGRTLLHGARGDVELAAVAAAHLIMPSATSASTQFWWVHTALNALNSPDVSAG